MRDATAVPGRRAASDYLRHLLLKPVYQPVWEQFSTRTRHGLINQLAVAEVLAVHLRSAPRSPADRRASSQRLKDTVSRALTGRLLSESALELFIDAFGFTRHEAGRLWRLWDGSLTIGAMVGGGALPAEVEQSVDAIIGPRQHRTLSLHDHVWAGPNGKLDHQRTIQVIEAIEPGLDRIPFLADASVLTVEVGQGCQQLGRTRQLGSELFATDILLIRTLGLGETLTLEYRLSYRWPDGPDGRIATEYRRGAMRTVYNLDMRVEFHPDCLPERVWWARWDSTDQIVEREQVSLDGQNSAHRFLSSLEKTVAGFCWDLRTC